MGRGPSIKKGNRANNTKTPQESYSSDSLRVALRTRTRARPAASRTNRPRVAQSCDRKANDATPALRTYSVYGTTGGCTDSNATPLSRYVSRGHANPWSQPLRCRQDVGRYHRDRGEVLHALCERIARARP